MERQRTFISIKVGADPLTARPVIASEDPFVIRAAFEAFRVRCGFAPALGMRYDGEEVHLVPCDEDDEGLHGDPEFDMNP